MKAIREERSVKDWVTEAKLSQQDRIINFLLAAYGLLLLATMVIFFLQGFHGWGFSLDTALLKWLGGATVGEIAGLLTITLHAVFGTRDGGRGSKKRDVT